jgi:hypothetical protein
MVRIPTPVIRAVQLYAVASLDADGAWRPAPPLSIVQFRDLGAIIADAPYQQVAPDESRVTSYRRVVEQAFAERTVLPAPFGTVFRSRESLLRWLELHYFTLTEALHSVEKRVMARVHVVQAAALTDATRANGGPALQAGHDAAALFQVLRRLSSASVLLPASGPEEQRMSFLVERERWASFRAAVRDEEARIAGATVTCTGPWPPYDFVRMQFTS